MLSKTIHKVTKTDCVWFEFIWIRRYFFEPQLIHSVKSISVYSSYFRWFYLENNKLCYSKRSGDDVTIIEDDLRICLVRPLTDIDRRFCFEIISPTNSHVLQVIFMLYLLIGHLFSFQDIFLSFNAQTICNIIYLAVKVKPHTPRPVNDATEGSTQEAPMCAS